VIEEMTTAAATTLIQELADTDTYPALSEALVTRCVTVAKAQDSVGLEPTDDEWTETFDIAAGVALAWQLKAAKAVPKVDMEAGGNQKFKLSQVHDHCLAQVEYWRSQMAPSTARLKTYEHLDVEEDEWPQVGFNVDGVRRS
jgi:hypothetical protein